MRLSKFIMTNLEVIVTEWESFASTMLPEKQFDRATLRDDAAQILSTIAQDMETPQTASQQTEKSQGSIDGIDNDFRRARNVVKNAQKQAIGAVSWRQIKHDVRNATS